MSSAQKTKQKPLSLDEALLATITRWSDSHNDGKVELTKVVTALSTALAAMVTECPDPMDQFRLIQTFSDHLNEIHTSMNIAKRTRESDAASLSRN
jgi:hypothetical protein